MRERSNELQKHGPLHSLEISAEVADRLRATGEWEEMRWVFQCPIYWRDHYTAPKKLAAWNATHATSPQYRVYIVKNGDEYIVVYQAGGVVRERRMAFNDGIPVFLD
jgi:hypothetical protein